MSDRRTVAPLRALKGNRQILAMHVDSAAEAAAAKEAGIDMFPCESDEKLPAVRASAPNVFIQAGSAQVDFSSPEAAVREGLVRWNWLSTGSTSPAACASCRPWRRKASPCALRSSPGELDSVRDLGPQEATRLFRSVKVLESAGGCGDGNPARVEAAAFIKSAEIEMRRLLKFADGGDAQRHEGDGEVVGADAVFQLVSLMEGPCDAAKLVLLDGAVWYCRYRPHRSDRHSAFARCA